LSTDAVMQIFSTHE